MCLVLTVIWGSLIQRCGTFHSCRTEFAQKLSSIIFERITRHSDVTHSIWVNWISYCTDPLVQHNVVWLFWKVFLNYRFTLSVEITVRLMIISHSLGLLAKIMCSISAVLDVKRISDLHSDHSPRAPMKGGWGWEGDQFGKCCRDGCRICFSFRAQVLSWVTFLSLDYMLIIKKKVVALLLEIEATCPF